MKNSRTTALVTTGVFAILFGSAGIVMAADPSVHTFAEAIARPAVAGGTVAGAGVLGFVTWVRQRLGVWPFAKRSNHRRKHSVKLLYFP